MWQRKQKRLAPWVLAQKRPPQPKKFYRIKPISDARREQNKVYRKVRDQYMADHPICQNPLCCENSVELHHQRGRAGSLLTDTRFFKALCQECHRLCHCSPALARGFGLLCQKGDWGRIEP